ncbi:Chorismate mutase I [Dehalobacter sp. UNSWDHB]|uniref:prephenate dehydratase n=1 Tax=unclassified Dehalobacter TaxID=2635733 RepID=UPI00028B4A58|nr:MULTISPECIES: prephenate dehydratase [unclassified Dehalobacter]AFV03235.1 Chorismate mutase I / Prephenate dehydratase [Dehalobacter sp. DCA]AFV06220.1 Chorismate mutase I / Prephenate dehydratase [Dehalobacter sp. CF]EQB21017.1 Chorismate mutase I [Dehalobacter sp. UNSWDHB]
MDELKNRRLQDLRSKIDEIDTELLRLFEARMETVIEVAEYKILNSINILDESRENKVLQKIEQVKNKDLVKTAEEFLKAVMSISKGVQAERFFRPETGSWQEISEIEEESETGELGKCVSGNVVGFQGIPGSYSEQALKEYFGEGKNAKNYVNFEDVFQALAAEEIDYGVLPLENSFTGGIADVYDLLCQFGFYIVGEKCIQIDHNLLAVKGAKLEDIREVCSHPQGFQQSSIFLRKHPEWNQVTCSNTAVSAKKVADAGSKALASIASRRAAELYGLDILAEKINNNPANFTRFIIIGRKPELRSAGNKISLVVAISHEPGSLYRVLSHFARNGLNMMKIESRPMTDKTWEYLFYIDFEGNLNNDMVKKAVDGIEKESAYFQMLGNYPSDRQNR